MPSTTKPAAKTELSASREVECFYEYSPNLKATLKHGLRRIESSDDPRWEGELTQPPFNGDPRGYLTVAIVTRVDGERVKLEPICGYTYHMNKAREFMASFEQLKAAGAEKPWDVDRTIREILATAEEARKADKAQELEMLKDLLTKTLTTQKAEVLA